MNIIIVLFLLANIGILMGTFTGLVPGIHVNTLVLIVLAFRPNLPHIADITYCALIVAISITHSFVDFIPSTFLGAPNEDTAMSVLPAHKMLLEGRGYEVVLISAVGSFGAYVFAISFLVPLIYIIPLIYSLIESYIAYILIAVVFILIIKEPNYKKKLLGLGIFLLSGIFGILVLNSSAYASDKTLFPVFSGLFGISTVFLSLKDDINIPHQIIDNKIDLDKSQISKGIVTGSTAGMMVGLLPGVGSAQATLISQTASKDQPTEREYLTSVSSVNTSNAIFCLIALFTIGKPRNGAILAVSQIMPTLTKLDLFILVTIMGYVCAIAAIIHVYVGRAAAKYIKIFPYKGINVFIILFLIFMVFIFTQFIGLLILFVGFCIGILPPLLGIKRSHAMGVLMVPVILYFLDLSDPFISLIGI